MLISSIEQGSGRVLKSLLCFYAGLVDACTAGTTCSGATAARLSAHEGAACPGGQWAAQGGRQGREPGHLRAAGIAGDMQVRPCPLCLPDLAGITAKDC